MSDGPESSLEELLKLPIEQRIEAVTNDVLNRIDRFRQIEPHDLAVSLGVSQPWSPNGDWSFMRCMEKSSLEEHAELSSVSEVLESLYLIRDKLTAERFQSLTQYLEDDYAEPDFGVLTIEERALLEEAIAYRELERAAANGMCCSARYVIVSTSGYELRFEGDIEDDGGCIDLRTPYDFRDGRFINLENCVTDRW